MHAGNGRTHRISGAVEIVHLRSCDQVGRRVRVVANGGRMWRHRHVSHVAAVGEWQCADVHADVISVGACASTRLSPPVVALREVVDAGGMDGPVVALAILGPTHLHKALVQTQVVSNAGDKQMQATLSEPLTV